MIGSTQKTKYKVLAATCAHLPNGHCMKDSTTLETPRRHTGGAQEAPVKKNRRHQEATRRAEATLDVKIDLIL